MGKTDKTFSILFSVAMYVFGKNITNFGALFHNTHSRALSYIKIKFLLCLEKISSWKFISDRFRERLNVEKLLAVAD
jgi:hypothetical protein